MAAEQPGGGTRAVAIGGGHGLSRTLEALRRVVDDVTAVVTVADDGGSSGRLRRDLDVVPPGDLRMALAALAGDEQLAALLQYRFDGGELDGHSLGNLVLVALRDLAAGDMVAALGRAGRLLDVPGRVLPCTPTPLVLHAETDGGERSGQAAIARDRPPRRVWIEPADAPVTPAVPAALAGADLVVLGPGSLYTSLIPNLLVTGVASAVAGADAPVVLVANLREQPGETEGMDLDDHLAALAAHVPGLGLDVLVAHDGRAPAGPGRPLRSDGDPGGAALPVGRVVTADLIDDGDGHDPRALAGVLAALRRGTGA